jgi:hypothetical protein
MTLATFSTHTAVTGSIHIVQAAMKCVRNIDPMEENYGSKDF